MLLPRKPSRDICRSELRAVRIPRRDIRPMRRGIGPDDDVAYAKQSESMKSYWQFNEKTLEVV
jgi:hypothetical protein